MENNIYIIGSDADKNSIEALRPTIATEGYNLIVACPGVDNDAVNNAINAEKVAVWLSPNSNLAVFEAANCRKQNQTNTINIFAEPIQLSSEQRIVVGHNHSVFAAVSDNIVSDIISLLNQTAARIINNVSPTSETVQQASTEVTDDSESSEDSCYSFLTCFIMIVGTPLASYWISSTFNFHVDEWRTYITAIIAFIVEMIGIGGLIQRREKYGKSFLSGLLETFGWLTLGYYIITTCVNLYNLIFD